MFSFFITLESIKCYISKNIYIFSAPAPLYSKSIYFLFICFNALHVIYNFITCIQQIGKHGFYILNDIFYTGRFKKNIWTVCPVMWHIMHVPCFRIIFKVVYNKDLEIKILNFLKIVLRFYSLHYFSKLLVKFFSHGTLCSNTSNFGRQYKKAAISALWGHCSD